MSGQRHQEHNGVNTRIGILKTHQSQETSEANEGAEEGELKRKLILGVNIFWNQDCFKMAEHRSLVSETRDFKATAYCQVLPPAEFKD